MNTDDLIKALATAEPPVQPKPARQVLSTALGLGVLVALTCILLFGPREDLIENFPVVLAKTLFSAMFAVLGIGLVWRAGRAVTAARAKAWPMVAVVALSVLAGLGLLLLTPPQERLQALTGGGMPWCLVAIPALAIPAAVLIGLAARSLAPTRLALGGAAIGALSGGVGAMSYALYCPIDSVSFVMVWYSVAIALCAGVGALVGARLLRW